MEFSSSPEQERIREAIAKLCERFGDDYWLKKDREGGFPEDFHQALARDGWLGVAMPEAYGGAGLGIAEAAVQNNQLIERKATADGFASFPVWADGRRGGSIRAGTPKLGEHSREILVELGFDDGGIADLVKHGILLQS